MRLSFTARNGFESLPLRQFAPVRVNSLSARACARVELKSATNCQGVLKVSANDFSATCKFEPIFLRKSRFFSRFPSASKFAPCLASKTNWMAGSNRLARLASNDSNLPRSSAFRLTRVCFLETYSGSLTCSDRRRSSKRSICFSQAVSAALVAAMAAASALADTRSNRFPSSFRICKNTGRESRSASASRTIFCGTRSSRCSWGNFARWARPRCKRATPRASSASITST